MKSTEKENKKIESAFLEQAEKSVIIDAYCDGEKAQTEFDKNEKNQPPLAT